MASNGNPPTAPPLPPAHPQTDQPEDTERLCQTSKNNEAEERLNRTCGSGKPQKALISCSENKKYGISSSNHTTDGEVNVPQELTERQHMMLAKLRDVTASIQPYKTQVISILRKSRDARKDFEFGAKIAIPSPGTPALDILTRYELGLFAAANLDTAVTGLGDQLIATQKALLQIFNARAGIANDELEALLFHDPAGPVYACAMFEGRLMILRKFLEEKMSKMGAILENTKEYIRFQRALRGLLTQQAGIGEDEEEEES